MNYSIRWNDNKVKTLLTQVCAPCYNEEQPQEYAIISSETGGTVTVTSEKEIDSAIVRPLSLNIKPEIKDKHTIVINLENPAKFSLEVNGTWRENLIVFVSPTFVPNESKFENVVRFAPGKHELDEYKVEKDNTLVIFEEGAVLVGGLMIANRKNVTICGKGIITKENYQGEKNHCIVIKNCKDVNIFDITVAKSIRWTVAVFSCLNLHIRNINIFGATGNNDGIDVCNSKNVLVERVFTRTWDDSFCVKATGKGTASFSLGDDCDAKSAAFSDGNVDNLLFRDSTLWNDFARPMEIGVEMQCDYAKNISFKNIDVIHSMTGYPIMGIHHGDRARVSDILFDNIRLEDINGGQIFDLRITDSVWNQDLMKGNISNVTIRNIAVVEEQDIIPAHSRIEGNSASANISNVTLENFTFCGRAATSVSDCQIDVYDHVDGLKFIAPKSGVKTLNKISSELYFIDEPKLSDDGLYRAKASVRLKNLGKTEEKGDVRLHISPIYTAQYDSEKRAFALMPGETADYTFDIVLQAGKYVIGVQSSNPGVEYVFRYISLDAVVSDSIENATPYRFVNYYNEEIKDFRFAVKKNELLIQSPISAPLSVFAAMPVPTESNQVLFTCEETDFGTAPAIVNSPTGPIAAPQLRCPAEIWYVFKNEPHVKEIVEVKIDDPEGIIHIPFKQLHIPRGCKNFWLEFVLHTENSKGRRYPYSLFHSVNVSKLTHMFANVVVK